MKGLEFHVGVSGIHQAEVVNTFGEACKKAVVLAVSGGQEILIDVVCWSRAAARAWGGDAAVEAYNEDPEASVHERIVIKAESQGRIA